MKWDSGLAVLLMGLGAMAQKMTETDSEETPTKTSGDSASSTKSSTPETHTVAVGAYGHKFTPSEIEAKVGDTIEWRFYPAEHWVIRGDFDNPCIPYEYVGIDRKGFSSGSTPVKAISEADSSDAPTFSQVVNSTDPIYFYCGAPGSCVRYHMMGIINPEKGKSLKDWQKLAEEVDYQLRPGDEFPEEEDHPTTAPGSKSTSDSNGNNDDGNDSNDSGDSLSAGAIAGIAIGSVAVVLIAGIFAFFLFRRRRNNKQETMQNMQSPNTHPGHMSQATYTSVPTGPWNGSQGQKSPHQTSEQPFYPSGFSATQYNQQYPNGANGFPPHHHGSPPPASEMMSPATSPGYHQHTNTMSSGYTEQFQAYMAQQQQGSPKPPQEPAPVELAASVDPGNSPLPQYQSADQFNNNKADGKSMPPPGHPWYSAPE